jgi:hypothetical protein
MGDNSQLPKIPVKLEKPSLDNAKEPELLKTIEKLKRELEQKDLIIAKKDKQLESKDSEISLLTHENEKLKAINQEKDKQLAKYKEKAKQLSIENSSLIENHKRLKNTAKNTAKIKVKDNQVQTEPLKEKILLNSGENLSNALLKIKEPKNNSLAVKEKQQAELVAEIQV